ncbi:MAG: hypothetical protein K5685_12250 [Bacteroidales bacterium]|nr:hypothetical protein [Bacteroidales bacterium]
MKLLKINLLGVLLTLSCSVFCQSVYRSSTFESAVTNKTRTLTGLPGEKYKNNFAEYKITATFNPQTCILEGEEFVTYHANMEGYYNGWIYMHLYRNIYKKGAPRVRPCKPDDITEEGMEILEVKMVTNNGEQNDVSFWVSNTKLIIRTGSISAGDKVTLYVRWRNKIAASTHLRGGKYGDNSWFVPYWYPQIAVFDDVYGWDNIDHTGNEEFLFEFANYDVNLTIGENMYVWATGDLVNHNDIYSKKILDLYAKALKSDSEVNILTSENRASGLKKAENTWHFKADSVPDFVFCCSSDADWTGSSVQLAKNQKRTFTSTVHHSKGFAYVIPMTKKTLTYLSTQRPGVVYPYPHMTIFEGSGGMEFPMMINEDFDGGYDSDFFTTSHEVTHSYFPFLTGMYQNRYAFMDEGMTMYVPQNFQNSEFRVKDIIEEAARCVNYGPSTDNYVPVSTPSYSQTNLWVYTVNSYYKPQMAYTFLEEIVGDKVMDKILNVFTQSWKGKHPLPYDFFNLCENISELNLKDFFNSWFYSISIPDLEVSQVKDKTITIQNPGGLMLPIYLKVKYKDGSVEIIERNALCWAGGNNSVNMTVNKEITSVELGNSKIPDVNQHNNSWYAE